jgi:hypothetical protein
MPKPIAATPPKTSQVIDFAAECRDNAQEIGNCRDG